MVLTAEIGAIVEIWAQENERGWILNILKPLSFVFLEVSHFLSFLKV